MAKQSSDRNTPPSGNDFHYRVASYLETKGWEVQRSLHYVDLISRKSREIDIIARKSYNVILPFVAGGRLEKLLVRLIIDCKYVLASQHIDLYFEPKNINAVTTLAKDNNILRTFDESALLAMRTKIHHYLDAKEVVKTWSASGTDIFYKGWEQALHAMIYYRENLSEGNYTVDYPLLIVSSSDSFFRRDVDTLSSSPFTNNFQLAIDYSFPINSMDNKQKSQTKYFLVDVVNYPMLGSFLDQLEENDVEIMKAVMRSSTVSTRSRGL